MEATGFTPANSISVRWHRQTKDCLHPTKTLFISAMKRVQKLISLAKERLRTRTIRVVDDVVSNNKRGGTDEEKQGVELPDT